MQHIGPNPNMLNKEEISRLDIIKAISKMDKKISEADPCPFHVLKRFKEIFVEPSQILFQRSLNKEKFPAILKKTTVVPIFKNKGKRYDPANYRPISLLPTLSKIFETIVCQKLTAYLDKNYLFAQEQHGFRESRSTQSAVTLLTDDIKSNFDNRKLTGTVFFDFSKAFDLVDHGLLIWKLAWLGIHGPLLSWFSNYLNGRSISVKFNGFSSLYHTVDKGVPQGSILGPLLYCIHVNEVAQCFPKSKCLLYEDDVVVYVSGDTADEISEHLQNEIITFQKWCNDNCLCVNVTKTDNVSPKCVREQFS